MISYAKSKFPPVPVLNIALSVPGEGAQTELTPALIDTGSDFTLVPEKWLQAIDAPRSRLARVRGLWSSYQEITLFLVDVHLDIGILPGVEVVGATKSSGAFENEGIILGRNVLNMLILLLEGPAQQTHLLERRPRRF
jgi:predicted aspartyl protease